MPVKGLPSSANLEHLRNQAKDLLRDLAARDPQAAQRIREFHPRFADKSDSDIFGATLKLSDVQLTIARERGFASWTRLKRRVEAPRPADNLDLPMHERIEDPTFRHAVDLLDAGDAAGLRAHLIDHPGLVVERVVFEGQNYFRNPTLLEFVAENPIRRGKLPPNIVEIAELLIQMGATEVNAALELVVSGRVPREQGVQVALVELLCRAGANAGRSLGAALAPGERAAVDALLAQGARATLPVAAALGRTGDARSLIPSATPDERHRALFLAAMSGHVDIVRLLLDAGEDPSRYGPPGLHSHSTALHQAAFAGHIEVVKLLVERGAPLERKDTMWQGTAAGWAEHGGHTGIAEYLRSSSARAP